MSETQSSFKFSQKLSNSKDASSNLSNLYSISNDSIGSFFKYFSLTKCIENSITELKGGFNQMIIMVNPKQHLILPIQAQKNNMMVLESEDTYLKELMSFLNKVKTKNGETHIYDSIKVYQFEDKLKLLGHQSNRSSLNCESIETTLVTSLLNNKSCNLKKGLSLLYNDLELPLNDKKNQSVRIVIITGQNTSSVNSDLLRSVIGAFETSCNIVVNVAHYEEDYLFKNNIKGDLTEFVDFKVDNSDDSYTKTLSYVLKLFEGEESELASLMQKVIGYGKNLTDDAELSDFVKTVDMKIKHVTDFFEAITISLDTVRSKTSKKDSVQMARRSLEDVCSKNLMNKVTEPVKQIITQNQALIDRISASSNGQLKEFKDALDKLERKVKMSGKFFILIN